MPGLSGMAQTVTGLVAPSELGITLTHEHLLIDASSHALAGVREAGRKGRAGQPVTLENLWHVRRDWVNADDMRLNDEQEAIEEALVFKQAGGRTLVDVTTLGIGRDPLGLGRIARATGLNVVMGAGYYTMEVPQPGLDDKTEGAVTAEIVHDIEVGFGWPAVRAGMIGEIGTSWPIHPNERKVLRAAAAAQKETGAPLLIHPGRDERAPMEIIDILAEAGADVSRTIIGHLDRTVFDREALSTIAATGCYLEYDLFGQESSYYPGNLDIDMPNDGQRVATIRWLIEQGHLNQILVAHDIDRKSLRRKYGGPGLAHLIEDVAPIMRRRGMSEGDLDAIFVRNPASILAFA